MLAGLGAVLGLSIVLMAIDGSPFALALAALIGLVTLLRSRHHGFVGEIVPLVAVSMVALVAVEVSLVTRLVPSDFVSAAEVAVAFLDGVIVVCATSLAGAGQGSVDTRRWLSRLEYAVDAAVVPVAIGALGVYDLVLDQAKHLL
jgi:hypothetical protein